VSADDLLAKADSRLTAAARDPEAGAVERSLSASYYAMFYAAFAALEKVGVSRAKHSAVIAAFGEQFAKTKQLDVRHHSMLLGAFGCDPRLTTKRTPPCLGRRPRRPWATPGPAWLPVRSLISGS
jgi:uncharacterized protein (UPF0332 family)